MPLLNYTTKVNAQKTVTEVMGLLVAKGADEISIVYDDNQQPCGLKWSVLSPPWVGLLLLFRAIPTRCSSSSPSQGDGYVAGVTPPAGNTDFLADPQGLGGGPDGAT